MAYLIGHNEENRALEIKDLFVLGKDPSIPHPIQDESLEDRHCRIERRGEEFWIRDLRSTLGTYVNGDFCSEKQLTDGDQIKIGNTEFTFSEDINCSTQGLGINSRNEDWQKQLNRLGSVAKTDFPVLILGASGTGKEIIAKALHENSNRKMGPFVSVNCSALTETLIESELFGHIKGSFTGAICDRKGAFEAARGGTLFLDEIGDLPYGLQAKLLRALENNEIRPVGSDKSIETDVRIIAATHQNLTSKIMEKEFRADLYFRLNVVTVKPPCLIERMEDFEEILYKFSKSLRVRFSFGAIQKLKKHSWPGNIRELKNVVCRASALFPKQQINEEHLSYLVDSIPNSISKTNSYTVPGQTESSGTLPVIKEIERQMILKRLAANNGNQKRTAMDLGMPKSTLHDRLKYYNIDPRAFASN